MKVEIQLVAPFNFHLSTVLSPCFFNSFRAPYLCSVIKNKLLIIKKLKIMALKYKLVQKRNLGKDQDENPEKVYAQMVSGDLVTFEELIEEVGDSTVAGSAGVKAVLDRLNVVLARLNVVLARHLRNGRRVNVGELGTFRLNFGSQGVVGSDDFNTGLIREPRVRFLPGKALRTMKSLTSFERIGPETDGPDSGGGEEERPGEL